MRLAASLVALGLLLSSSYAEALDPPVPLPRPSPKRDLHIGAFEAEASRPHVIKLVGDIDATAAGDFAKMLELRPRASVLVTDSQGGSVGQALVIAQMVRDRGMTTSVPPGGGCFSACSYVFMGGVTRSVSPTGTLGVHQMYGGSEDPVSVQQSVAVLFEALRGLDVADAVIVQMLRTPPEGMHAFTRDELISFGIVTDAAVEEPVEVGPLHLVDADDPEDSQVSDALLLEASDSGTTGAVPFSGTVEWSKGTDEMGLPTLIGKANIPARNLAVDVLIRKNSDGSLPASHLMEVNFRVTDSFVGGSIAGLAGVLLKNEELVQGTPLVGYSERRSENHFVFALSDEPADLTANLELLASGRWMDLAVLYSTGKRAIVTLRLDDLAEGSITAVSRHGPYVQLATSPTLEDAYRALPSVEQRLQAVIPDARLSIRRVNLGNKGVWFRLVLGIADFQQAVTVCRDLQASGVDCVPIGG